MHVQISNVLDDKGNLLRIETGAVVNSSFEQDGCDRVTGLLPLCVCYDSRGAWVRVEVGADGSARRPRRRQDMCFGRCTSSPGHA